MSPDKTSQHLLAEIVACLKAGGDVEALVMMAYNLGEIDGRINGAKAATDKMLESMRAHEAERKAA